MLASATPPANEVETQEHAVALRHIADDPAQWQRQLPDERRNRDDLFVSREGRLLVDVDHFQVVPSLETLVANLADVPNRTGRPGRHAGHIEAKDVPLRLHDLSARRTQIQTDEDAFGIGQI